MLCLFVAVRRFVFPRRRCPESRTRARVRSTQHINRHHAPSTTTQKTTTKSCAPGVNLAFDGVDARGAAFTTASQIRKLNSFSLLALYNLGKDKFFDVVSVVVLFSSLLSLLLFARVRDGGSQPFLQARALPNHTLHTTTTNTKKPDRHVHGPGQRPVGQVHRRTGGRRRRVRRRPDGPHDRRLREGGERERREGFLAGLRNMHIHISLCLLRPPLNQNLVKRSCASFTPRRRRPPPPAAGGGRVTARRRACCQQDCMMRGGDSAIKKLAS